MILTMVQVFKQSAAKLGELPGRQLAEEDAELSMVTLAHEQVEDARAAFVVGDVVRQQVVSAGHDQRVVMGV